MAELRCDRESDVLEALEAGRAQAAFGDELHQHTMACAACSELIEVAGALLDDRRVLMREADLPGSGLVWWRATMRARHEKAITAMRTARLLQVTLVIVSIAVAFALLGLRIAAADVRQLAEASAAALLGLSVPVILFGAWLILAPLAAYFVLSEE